MLGWLLSLAVGDRRLGVFGHEEVGQIAGGIIASATDRVGAFERF